MHFIWIFGNINCERSEANSVKSAQKHISNCIAFCELETYVRKKTQTNTETDIQR